MPRFAGSYPGPESDKQPWRVHGADGARPYRARPRTAGRRRPIREAPAAPARTAPRRARDWLAVGPASRLLGVDPDTVRRWADGGRIAARRTVGGHRRVSRTGLEWLVRQRSAPAAIDLAALGVTPARLSAAYRRTYGRGEPAALDLVRRAGAADRERFRDLGRALVAALVRYLDASSTGAREDAEHDALSLADELAERLAGSRAPIDEAVAMFVAARRPFLAELGATARRRGIDGAHVTGRYEAATGLLDRLLLAFVGALVRAREAGTGHIPGAPRRRRGR